MQENIGIQVEVDDKGNKIVGCYPGLYQSAIVWTGSNNVLYCEKGVDLKNSKLTFNGNNSLIYLHSSEKIQASLDLSLFSDSVIHIGRRCRAKQTVKVVIGEKKHLFIGDDCLFSYGITLRNADGHMVYSVNDYSRTNSSKSIFLGDHVWVGQDSLILKGTQIDSGSIIGGCSVVSGKRIGHNSSWAGNPARCLKEGVFWDLSFPDDFSEELLDAVEDYRRFLERRQGNCEARDRWIYTYAEDEAVSFEELDERLSCGTAMEKCEYLKEFNESSGKNRFVH